MDNRDTRATWYFHDGTKHPFGYLFDPAHRWDFRERPLLAKRYPHLERISLPLDLAPRGVSALQAIKESVPPGSEARIPDLDALARVLYFSGGITKYLEYPPPWGRIAFRAAACTGALYHIELYVVCADLPGLAAGVYHFNPQENALARLRTGDYRRILVEASGDGPSVGQAPAILAATSVIGRNAAKYQARAYRHAFWDSGTILANALASAAAHRLPARVVLGFVDGTVGRLLDLDPRRELPLALVPLGAAPGSDIPPAPPLAPLNVEAEGVPEYQRCFPAIREMHEASSLQDATEAASWRGPPPPRSLPAPAGRLVALEPLPEAGPGGEPLETVIVRRGSTRRFAREAITFRQLSMALSYALQAVPADFLAPPVWPLNDVYLIVNAVEGLAPGAYVLHRDRWALELLRAGEFRAQARHLALDQELAGDASVAIFFLAGLAPILERFGNRGYRAAQLEAAIAAGRLYLAAYALRCGATGLTFYDDDVTAFFSPHAQGKSVMFLLALGRPARRRRPA